MASTCGIWWRLAWHLKRLLLARLHSFGCGSRKQDTRGWTGVEMSQQSCLMPLQKLGMLLSSISLLALRQEAVSFSN